MCACDLKAVKEDYLIRHVSGPRERVVKTFPSVGLLTKCSPGADISWGSSGETGTFIISAVFNL